MLRSKIKKLLEQKEAELKMNLSNNYKDLAREALNSFSDTLEQCFMDGEIKEKDYLKWKDKVNQYTISMKDYHH